MCAILLLLAALVTFSDGSRLQRLSQDRPNDQGTHDLWDVLSASKGILDFYKPHITDINIDVVIGTRGAEGQYAVLLDAIDRGTMTPVDDEAVDVLRQLHEDIRNFNTKALDFLTKEYPERIKNYGALLAQDFINIPLAFLHLDNSSTSYKDFDNYKVLQGVEQLHEGQSDECLAEVLLTGEQKKVKSQKLCYGQDLYAGGCLISGWCWSTMTGRGYSGYSLTHQLLYLITAMQKGCKNQMDDIVSSIGREPVEDIMQGFCHTILMEAMAIDETDYPELLKDLFMEQGALCGSLGYDNFHTRPWVKNVLSWQRALGCYGDYQLHKSLEEQDNTRYRFKREENSMPGHKRTKRAEKSMPGNCMAHLSATAISYLAVAVKTLIFM